MQRLFSFLKECLDAFQVAYKYAELDFFKLRGEVTTLLDKARSKGYGNPDYCEMRIQIVDSFQTIVSIQSFYKGNNGKFYRFKSDLDLGKLTNVPYIVQSQLRMNEEVTIRLTDFNNLYSIGDNEIIPVGDFKRIHIFTFKDALSVPVRKEIFIRDDLFYYTVKCSYIYENGEKETRVKYYGSILNLPQDIIDNISNDSEKECVIDVTNS